MKLVATIEVPLVEGQYGFNAEEVDARELESKLPPGAILKSAKQVAEPHDMKAEFKRILRWRLEGTPEHFTKLEGYEEGDEGAPFYSERFLYPLLGKEDARSVLAHLRGLMRLSGLDPYEVEREAWAEELAEREAEKKRQERIAARKAFRENYIKEKGWKKIGTFTGLTDKQDEELRKAMKEAGL